MIDLDLLPDAVLRVDADRRVVDGNLAITELTGYSLDDLRGKRLEEALDPRGGDGKPLLAEGWHSSTRLRSVARIPEQEVRIRRANDGLLRATVGIRPSSIARLTTGSASPSIWMMTVPSVLRSLSSSRRPAIFRTTLR